MVNSVMFLSFCSFGLGVGLVPTNTEGSDGDHLLKVKERVVYSDNVYKYYEEGKTSKSLEIEYHTLPTNWKKDPHASN